MKRLLAVHSTQTSETEKERKVLESIFHEFEIEHYVIENKKNIPMGIDGIIFGNSTDCIQIVILINKLTKQVTMIRIYSAPKGYGDIPKVEVFQDITEASVYMKGFFLN